MVDKTLLFPRYNEIIDFEDISINTNIRKQREDGVWYLFPTSIKIRTKNRELVMKMFIQMCYRAILAARFNSDNCVVDDFQESELDRTKYLY